MFIQVIVLVDRKQIRVAIPRSVVRVLPVLPRSTCACQWRTEGGFGVFNPPLPEILKALQNRAKLNLIVKTVKNCWI